MYKGKFIAVVVPAYNEERFVGDVIETVPSFVDRIYPVDDRSTDDTWAEIRAATMRINDALSDSTTQQIPDGGLREHTDERVQASAGRRKRTDALAETQSDSVLETPAVGGSKLRVVPLRHDQNSGVGAAIKTGYTQALHDGMDVVAVMNGDGQMDPDILDEILNPVVEGRAAYAKGDRLVTSDHWNGMTRWRLFGNFILTMLTRIASGYWGMSDPQNGYTAISAAALEQLELEELYDEYGFLNDLLTRLNAHEMRIADVEMTAVYGEEDSSIRYSRFIPRLSLLLLQNFGWRLWTKYRSNGRLVVLPYLLGTVGGVLLLVSLAMPTAIQLTGGILGLFLCCILIVVGMTLDRQRNRGLEMTVRK